MQNQKGGQCIYRFKDSKLPLKKMNWLGQIGQMIWKWDYCEMHFNIGLSSVQLCCSVLSDSLWPHEPQHAGPPRQSPTPRFYPNSCALSRWCCPSISSSVTPSPPSFSFSQHQGVFHWVGSSHQVAKILEFQLQHQSFQWIFRTDLL